MKTVKIITQKLGRLSLSLLLSLAMLIGPFAGITPVYADEDNVVLNEATGVSYNSVITAFGGARNGDSLKLLRDAALSEALVTRKEITFDMNGYSLNLAGYSIYNSGVLNWINTGDDTAVHYIKKSTWQITDELSDDEKEKAGALEEIEDVDGYSNFKVSGSVVYNGRGFTTLGGAFLNNETGELYIDNISIIACSASKGGAIDNMDGTVSLNNINAYGCLAEQGGFVCNDNASETTVENSTAKFCTASAFGGAIVNLGGTSSLNNVKAYGCNAANGGFVFNCSNVIVEKSTAKFCNANENGGAIANLANADVKKLDAFGCKALTQNGGCIYNTTNAVMDIEDSSIKACTSYFGGGGIDNCGYLSAKKVTIEDCTAGNDAAGTDHYGGGALFQTGYENGKGLSVETVLADVNIKNSIDLKGYSVMVWDSTFEMKSGYVEDSLAVVNHMYPNPASNIKIHTGTFKNYVPDDEYLSDESAVRYTADPDVVEVVKSSTVKNLNTGDTYPTLRVAFEKAGDGAALQLLEDTVIYDTLANTKDLTLDMNGYSLDLGGKSIWNVGKLAIVNTGDEERIHYFDPVTLSENSAISDDEKASAIDPWVADEGYKKYVAVKGSVIYNGRGVGSPLKMGGAVINGIQDDKKGSLSVNNIAFVRCIAPIGGVIENEGSSVVLDNVLALGCSANNGGLVYNNKGSDLIIKDSELYRCKAMESGGAVYNFGNLEVDGLTADRCDCVQSGGLIYNDNSGTARIKGLKASSCHAGSTEVYSNGGVVANDGDLSVEDSQIRDCSGYKGGAFFNAGKFSLKNSSVDSCSARAYGGAIYNDGDAEKMGLSANAILENVRIENCTAPNHGIHNESIYVNKSSLEMISGYLENKIFANNRTVAGDLACDIKIHAGQFRNYTPAQDFVVEGNTVLTMQGTKFAYVV
ncbi:MAG: hypothetical protein IKR68_00005, partial [Lachnospiraceae bacterium]|nr:hypothetical protein [Lachnospiraceae bacterium]